MQTELTLHSVQRLVQVANQLTSKYFVTIINTLLITTGKQRA